MFGGRKLASAQAEFEAIAFPLMDRLYSRAHRMTRNSLDAEDLVQSTYLKAWRYYHSFIPGTNFQAWIFRILTNTYINAYRQEKRMPLREDFEVAQAVVACESSTAATQKPPNDIDDYRDVFDDTVTSALNKLPEKYRHAVLMKDLRNLSYQEIAKLLDCPIGTIMSRISRGRRLLSRYLQAYATEKGLS